MIRFLLAFLLLSANVSGQIELSYTKAKSLVGATSPRLAGDAIIIGEDSKPQIVTAAVIKIESTERVRLKARKSLFEFVELSKISETEFLLSGEGEYLVEAVSFSWDASVKIKLGENPQPPDPPEPDNDEISNVYGVGKIAFATAVKDKAAATKLATSYRVGASKLFGNGGLSDIESILKQINADILALGDKWKPFNEAVSKALKAEQTKRGSFSRQDWYTALVEIAAALEKI